MNNYGCFSYCLLTIINMGTLLFASKNEAAVICQVIYLPQDKKPGSIGMHSKPSSISSASFPSGPR